MSGVAVVDDGLVAGLLRGRRPPTDLALQTTNAWWWRLAAALRRRRSGRLSGPVLARSEAEQAEILAAVERLPEIIAIEDLRAVLPLAADLHGRFGLQLLAAEAAAVALMTDAEILVGIDTPKLAAACADLDVPYRVVT